MIRLCIKVTHKVSAGHSRSTDGSCWFRLLRYSIGWRLRGAQWHGSPMHLGSRESDPPLGALALQNLAVIIAQVRPSI